MTHQPTEINPTDTPDLTTEDGELLLYGLHGMLSSLALDMKITPRGMPRDIQAALSYLEDRDPASGRVLRYCLNMATLAIEEASAVLDSGINWNTIEALYHPTEDNFIDCPGHWYAIGQAEAQSARNGARSPGPAHPTPADFATPEAAEPIAAPEPAAAPQPTRRASKGALRSLGRELRSETENEKRRFYAIAKEHGLPTGSNAGDAIRAALSQMLGEPIASRKQLTARQWGLAASSIETEDLFWEAPAPKRQPRAAELRA